MKAARTRLGIVATAARGSAVAAKAILPEYRLLLVGRGEETGLDEDGQPLRRGFKPEEVDAVLAAKGRLDHWQMLRCRVRYFADGLALGTKTFVNEVFASRREHFGPKRTTGARALRGMEANGLCALRDLRVRVVGDLSRLSSRGERRRVRTICIRHRALREQRTADRALVRGKSVFIEK